MRKVLLFIALLIFTTEIKATSSGKIVASIPFEMVGGYIIMKVCVNQSSPLKFILDTGVRNTIITELHENDSISLNYSEVRDLKGLGMGTDLNAFISNGNTLKTGKLKLMDKSVMVLKEDLFNLSRETGVDVNGLIGFDIFRDYIIQIDYSTLRLKFYDKSNFIVPKGYGVMPMLIEKQKMFIQLSVLETDSARRTIKMLIQTLTNKAINIPEKSIHGRIGEGLGGEITGHFARVPQICIANFCVKDPIVAFPDSATIAAIVQNSDRDGTIGSQLLSRFNLIIDTFNKNFYFKPNGNFNKPFTYNVAGIEVIQMIPKLPQVEVINVWKNSPGEKAGIKPGDVIVEINYEQAYNYNVSQIKGIFERTSKRPLKLLLQRGLEKFEVQLDMNGRI